MRDEPLDHRLGQRELWGLLGGARERYRTARATILHRRRGDLATEATRRYTEYGFAHGILSNFDPPYDVPRHWEYGDLEETSRLWHARPDRWRQETDTLEGIAYRVADGTGPWWSYDPTSGLAMYSPTNDNEGGHPELPPDDDLASLLDPSVVDDCTLTLLGRSTNALGREVVEVRAEAISWDYHPYGPFWEGADDYVMSVDLEVGVLLRFASRLGGVECDVLEVTEIAFDEAFEEGTFRLDLPGVEWRNVKADPR